MAATSNLPPEIIEIILLNLPTKSLLRFKSVSKSWNTIISDPIFLRNHHNRSKNSDSHNLFLSKFPLQRFHHLHELPLLKLNDGKFQTVQVFQLPNGCHKVLCSCDGVVLLEGDMYQSLVLWNPSTGTAKNLWHRSNCFRSKFGLCHDPITDDFKVVIVAFGYYSLYSCKNESWIKEREPPAFDRGHIVKKSDRVMCVDGASYWVWNSYSYINNKRKYKIVYFDPRDDEFKILQKPENIMDDTRRIYLTSLRGRLCVYCNGEDTETVKIWTKEEGIDNNSWKDLITVENVRTQISFFVPLCFVESKIVIQIEGEGLVVYSPCEKKFKKFEGTEALRYTLFPCMNSMFFPIEQNWPNKKRKLKELTNLV